MLNTSGIAGHVFTSGEPLIIHEPYSDPRFNSSIDEQTGFVTRNIVCVPIRTVKGAIIGVAQSLNKREGEFTQQDLETLAAMTTQGTVALQGAVFIERMKALRAQEMEFVEIVSEVTADIKLGSLLQRVMGEATRLLNAERSTLFLNDEKTNELWSEVGQGLQSIQIRFPNHRGIAGAVFTSGKSINIPYAYADLRFNPAFDKQTGFFTRSILCVPIVNKQGKVIGVTQVLNKRGGPFTAEDESRLRAFTAQISIALENAKLFADVQNMKNYSEAMLESMSNGVITLDEHGTIVTCNAAGLRILRADAAQRAADAGRRSSSPATTPGCSSSWRRSSKSAETEVLMDAELTIAGERISTNVTVMPLTERRAEAHRIDDPDRGHHQREAPQVDDVALHGPGRRRPAGGRRRRGARRPGASRRRCSSPTSAASPRIRRQLGPQGTVAMLNEYFTLMVDCIQREGGMLDKFIGDAMMAGFGVPVPHDDDGDRAVRAAIAMIGELRRWNAQRAVGRPRRHRHRHRPEHRYRGVGQHRIEEAHGLHDDRRRREPRLAPGVRLQAVRRAHPGERVHLPEAARHLPRARGRPAARQGQDASRSRSTRSSTTTPRRRIRACRMRSATSATRWRSTAAVSSARPGRSSRKCWRSIRTTRRRSMYVDRCNRLEANPPAPDWGGVWVMEGK